MKYPMISGLVINSTRYGLYVHFSCILPLIINSFSLSSVMLSAAIMTNDTVVKWWVVQIFLLQDSDTGEKRVL